MGYPYIEGLMEQEKEDTCQCSKCDVPLCFYYEVKRTDYQCQSGKAYFVDNVRNVIEGIDIEKHFISGKYIIREINCI